MGRKFRVRTKSTALSEVDVVGPDTWCGGQDVGVGGVLAAAFLQVVALNTRCALDGHWMGTGGS